jgi:hypothetical protein
MIYIGLGAFSLGLLLALVGWIWLIVLGFRHGGVWWGILIILFNWFAGLAFWLKYKKALVPLVLTGVGVLVMLLSQAIVYMSFCCGPMVGA